MLQQMRKLPRWVAAIFFLPLVVSFGIWGIGDIFRGNTDTSVATVGGTRIEYQDFSRQFDNLRKALARQGQQMSPERTATLAHQTLEREISDTALDNEARNLDLVTADEQVAQAIRSIQGFQNQLGSFDEQIFRQTLQRLGYTEAGFVAEVRRELTRQQLVQSATSAFILPSDYTQAFFSFLNEHRAVQYVVLPQEAAGIIQAPPDEALAGYIKSHAFEFSSPEYRELTYAEISPDDVANQVLVSEAQIHQVYDLRKDSYVIPDKRDIERINFPDEASAKAARAKIDAGAKFEDIAKQRGISASDLSLGTLSEADLGSTQGPIAFALPLNAVSQPVKYAFGWSLLRVSKIVPGNTKTLADVRDSIKAELMKQLEGSKIEDDLNAFEDARNQGDDLATAAKKAGLRVVRVPGTDAKGLSPDGSKAAVSTAPEFLAEAFKADVGSEGDPFAASDGSRYVIKVEGVVPAKIKSLESVRQQATAAWMADQRRAELGHVAEDAAGKVDSIAALQALASQYRQTVQSSGALARDTPTPAISAALNTKIFASPAGKAVWGPAVQGGGRKSRRDHQSKPSQPCR